PVVLRIRACTATAVFAGVVTFQLGISWVNGCAGWTQPELQLDQDQVLPAVESVPTRRVIRTALPDTLVPALVPDRRSASLVKALNPCWPAVEEAASRA